MEVIYDKFHFFAGFYAFFRFLLFTSLKRLHVACILPNTFLKKSVAERLVIYD